MDPPTWLFTGKSGFNIYSIEVNELSDKKSIHRHPAMFSGGRNWDIPRNPTTLKGRTWIAHE